MSEYVTVPEAAKRLGESLDWVRKQLRNRPELRAMFTTIGPTRVLPVARFDEFKTLLKAK